MAVSLEFHNLIIPIENIARSRQPGGWAGLLAEDMPFLGSVIWHDEHLYRTGAMDSMVMMASVKHWERLGLESLVERNGIKEWRDLCVVHANFDLRWPCSWLSVDRPGHCAWHSAHPKGPVIGPTTRPLATNCITIPMDQWIRMFKSPS